jgi:hypothetical protein
MEVMQQTDVAQAIATLQSQGKPVSVQNLRRTLGGGSLRDIIKYRNALVPPAEAAPPPAQVPARALTERPLKRCWQCGTCSWWEWDVGVWRCVIDGLLA